MVLVVTPQWRWRRGYVTPKHWWALDRSRRLAEHAPFGALYANRIDELELEMMLVERIGRPSEVRPLAIRRFGDGTEVAELEDGQSRPLNTIAQGILRKVDGEQEPRTIPAQSKDSPGEEGSALGIMRAVLRVSGVPGEARVDARLAAGAATGDRLVFIADRKFGQREISRFAIHEILGHLTSAANGRSQPLGILEYGTARSFADQEGVALYLEEQAGLLDGGRLRTMAARVVIARWMHEGASFHESVYRLHRDSGVEIDDAVVLAERAYRGGGIARDVCYLRGWLRVRAAVRTQPEVFDLLRLGRVGVDDISTLKRLFADGLVRPPCYLPNLSVSLAATAVGTSAEMSPPSLLTSLTRLDAT